MQRMAWMSTLNQFIKKSILIFLFLFISNFVLANSSLKDRLILASPGDYIVTAQGNLYSLLVVDQSIKLNLF